MKSNLKKTLGVLLCAATLAAATMTGCAQQPASGSGAEGSPDAAAASAASTPISWYFPGNGQPADAELVASKVDEYLKDKLNIKLSLHCFDYGSYVDKMKNMAAAGEDFDICFTASWGLNYQEMASKGAYLDITDLFGEYAPKTKAQLGEDFLKGSLIKGRRYAVPTLKEKAQQYGFLFLQKYIDKYNIDLRNVKTAQDLEPILKTIKQNEPELYDMGGGWDACLKGIFDDMGAGGYGVLRLDNDDFKVVLREAQPEFKDYCDLAYQFYNEGYIRQDAATVTDQSGDEKSGKMFCKCSSLKPGKDKEYSQSTGQDWVQVAITPAIITNGDTMGSMNAISATSKNPEKALQFLEYVNTDKVVNNLISYGVEGVHYIKVGENQIKKGPDYAKYCPGTNYMFGNVFLNYLWDNEDPNKWKEFEEFNDVAVPAPSLGFAFDPAPVKNEIAACETVRGDYEKALVNGTVNPDEILPKYLAALKTAGVDKVIAEKQKQLDQWRASGN